MPHIKPDYDRKVLQAIAAGGLVTQRSLSKELGVALGLTNLLMRRLVSKGYVKMSRMGARHIRYLITPSGWEALAQATRLSLENTVHLYTQTREQISSSLAQISDRCQPDADGCKSVVFYGAGDVAEIAFVSLQRTDLILVGVVDDRRTGRFFGFSILPPEHLTDGTIGEVPFSHVVVTSLRHADAIRGRVLDRGVPADRVSCL